MVYALPLEIIFKILVSGISVLYWGMAFAVIYHLVRFGIGVQPKRLAAIFFLGSMILSSLALILFTRIDISTLITP